MGNFDFVDRSRQRSGPGGLQQAALHWRSPSRPAFRSKPVLRRDGVQVNSGRTLDYLQGINKASEYMHVRERGFKAGGPLFDRAIVLPRIEDANMNEKDEH
jgi:hypothetical protein